MREARRNQLAVGAILLVLFVLSVLVVDNLDTFSLPSASNILVTSTVNRVSIKPDGLLLITVESNLTVLSGSQYSDQKIGQGGFVNSPLNGVYVSITSNLANSRSITNFTDSSGQVAEYLPPAKYQIGFLDWRFNYSLMSVEVYSGKATDLRAFLNASAYFTQSYNIIDPSSSGWAVGWEPMYILVPSKQVFSDNGADTFIETSGSSPVAILKSENASTLTHVSILGNIANQNSEWLEVQIGSPISVQNIQAVDVLSMKTIYLVS